MDNFVFRTFAIFRQNYWFWPSIMTAAAVLLGFILPYVDARLGADWIRAAGFIRATEVEGARAILTTLAGATLGVAGVAFSVTIVAVSFASSNYGPRLIGNFMGDRKNQIVLGIFVATFVYCITVLSKVHGEMELSDATLEAVVPQISVFFALLLTLASVSALIAYIHHIPESINVMNLTADIGDKLQRAVIKMLDEENHSEHAGAEAKSVAAWQEAPRTEAHEGATVCATTAGFLQKFDLDSLATIACAENMQIVLHHAPGDFVVAGTTIMSTGAIRDEDGTIAAQMRKCYTQGTNRTDEQDVLFLSDQLVEVLGRALSSGVNDSQTALLCLDWLRAGLVEFARRPPVPQARKDDPVLYRRIAFSDMLNRSFGEMRQYIAADRTAALHALGVLTDIALATSRQLMADACVDQISRLGQSARELLGESVARAEIEAEVLRALATIAAREPQGGT